MSIFDIFRIFKKNSNLPDQQNLTPHEHERLNLEQERLKRIDISKNNLYGLIFNEVQKRVKNDYINNKNESYILVDRDFSLSNLDKDTQHRVALKATHDSILQLGIKAEVSLNIGPEISIRVYW